MIEKFKGATNLPFPQAIFRGFPSLPIAWKIEVSMYVIEISRRNPVFSTCLSSLTNLKFTSIRRLKLQIKNLHHVFTLKSVNVVLVRHVGHCWGVLMLKTYPVFLVGTGGSRGEIPNYCTLLYFWKQRSSIHFDNNYTRNRWHTQMMTHTTSTVIWLMSELPLTSNTKGTARDCWQQIWWSIKTVIASRCIKHDFLVKR